MSPHSLLGGTDDTEAILDRTHSRSVTYGELTAMVNALSASWKGTTGSLAFLGFATDLDSIVAYLALMRDEATVVLLDPGLSAERIARLEEAYRPDIVLGFAAVPDRMAPAGRPPLDDRILLSTSGSTGSPKLVRLSAAAIEASAHQIIGASGITADDRALLGLPLHYSFGLSVLNSHLVAGAAVVIGSQPAVSPDFARELSECAVTNLHAVPFSVELFRRTGLLDEPPEGLRTLTVAGGRLAPEATLRTHASLSSRDIDLLIRYGATEATSAISILPPGELPTRVGSAGLPLPGVELRILDPDTDGVGRIEIHGPNVMLGYAESRDDLGKDPMTATGISTGDSGRIDADGFLWVTGRTGRFAKVHGTRVSLDHIEMELSGSMDCAALERDGHVIVVIANPPESLPGQRDLERRFGLGPGTVEIQIIDTLPRTASGKIDQSRLAQLMQG